MLDTINPTTAEIGEFATSLRKREAESKSQKPASLITQKAAQQLADDLVALHDMLDERDWHSAETIAEGIARRCRVLSLEARCDEMGVVR